MSLTDSLRFAYVCPLAWDKLTKSGASARHCDACQKTVTDLSALSRRDADAFLASAVSARDSVCVRIARDTEGRSLHAPLVAIAGFVAVAAIAGCQATPDDSALDTSNDTADTADTGDTAIPEVGSAGSSGGHAHAARHGRRPVGSGLGTDDEISGDDDGGEAAGTEASDDDGLDALLSALTSKVAKDRPKPEEAHQYITMGVMAMPSMPPANPPPVGK